MMKLSILFHSEIESELPDEGLHIIMLKLIFKKKYCLLLYNLSLANTEDLYW